MIVTLLFLAQLHVATPVEKLHPHARFGSEVPPAPEGFNSQAAKSINIVARQFEFDVSDAQIMQGDSVTLVLRSEDVTHGFFLESYMNQGVTLNAGEPVTVNFIANTPGTFTYFCSVFCGGGHGFMFGELTVNAIVAAAPEITAFTPRTAPDSGGTPVLITGTGFVANATVRFGEVNALVTIVNSPTSITAMTPGHAAGTVALKVINPDGQTALAQGFTFTAPEPAPPRPSRRRAVRR